MIKELSRNIMSAMLETGVLRRFHFHEHLFKEVNPLPHFYELYEKGLLELDLIGISLLLVLALNILYARCQEWEFKERKLQVAFLVSTELMVAVYFRKELVEWFLGRGFLLLIFIANLILALTSVAQTIKDRDLLLYLRHNDKAEALNHMIRDMFVVVGFMIFAILVTLIKVNPPPVELEQEQSHHINITMIKEVSRNIMSRFFKEGKWKRHIEQAFRLKTKPIIVNEVNEKEVLVYSIIIALILAIIVVIEIYERWVYRSKTSDKGWKTNEVCINDFANISEEEESDKFSCFGHTWCLVAVTSDNYHLGSVNTTRGTISLFLHSPDIDTDIGIVFCLAIIDSKGRILRLHDVTHGRDTNRTRVNYPTFSVWEPYWGMNIGSRFLLKHFCLVEGALRVEVKMRLASESDNHEVETLWSRFKTLYFTKLSSLMTVCGRFKTRCYTKLVSLRSSFKTLYSTKRLSYISEDCPICLEPISQPWGVVTPCGHPCHLSCWDQVVTRHQRSDDGWESDDEALPSCVVCRKRAIGFQQVYLALGSAAAATSGDN